ncbi:unnamed protein product [Polarella glacialis]|uniref:Uncharacterized protein n=1 Tax=Polarella glacialis TaxID=89957 RepID=A0A813EDP4_POLGL|nr:unnamed protein product [Polarella glacialis]
MAVEGTMVEVDGGEAVVTIMAVKRTMAEATTMVEVEATTMVEAEAEAATMMEAVVAEMAASNAEFKNLCSRSCPFLLKLLLNHSWQRMHAQLPTKPPCF